MTTTAHILAEELAEQRQEEEGPSLSSAVRCGVLVQRRKKETENASRTSTISDL